MVSVMFTIEVVWMAVPKIAVITQAWSPTINKDDIINEVFSKVLNFSF